MSKPEVDIREFKPDDWAPLFSVLEPVIRAGETYALPPEMSRDQLYEYWIERPTATFVAWIDGQIAGTYYLKPNQLGPGSHVCNCGYVVAESARGQGVASAMCEHSQAEAKRRQFRAMQYNLVVAANQGAIRLWQKHQFQTIGVLPQAFRHPSLGYVDALVMYKLLVEAPTGSRHS